MNTPWHDRLRLLAAAMAVLVTVACSDAPSPGPAPAAVELARSVGATVRVVDLDPRVLTRRSALDVDDGGPVRRAATELFDLGERAYAQYFPSRQPDRVAGALAYRYYPETQAFLVVDQTALQVYVLGGPFGTAVTLVGDVITYVPCVPVSIGYPERGFDGAGGEGSSPGTDGGVGGASADGAVRGADVSLFDANGTLVGQGVSDDKGTVRLKACGRNGPFKIEYRGNDRATYFDEALPVGEGLQGDWRPFTSSETLVAYVPDLSTHVTVSPLTQAAALRLESIGGALAAAPGRSGRADAAGTQGRVERAAVTVDAIRAANESVRTLVNRQFEGTGLSVADIARPPQLAYTPGSLQVFANDDRGRYAQMLVALAKSAAAFNPGLARPAREMTRQLSTDLSDGVIDGRDRLGQPVAPPATRAYDPQVLAPQLVTQSAGRLVTQSSGAGSVSVEPAGSACAGGGSGRCYPWGTSVTLVARADAGGSFRGWSGSCAGTTGDTCRLEMSGDKTVGLAFDVVSVSQRLVVESAGNGSVSSLPAGITCGSACSASYAAGTPVTLTATPGPGAFFSGWSGDCAGLLPTCTLSMSAARSVRATFVSAPTLLVTRSGTGSGLVRSDTTGIDCGVTCSSSAFPVGTSVTLTATPAAGSVFAGWGGDCSGTALTCTVSMSTSRTVSANFSGSSATLAVSTRGTGGGTVRSSPPGIDCGTTCTSSAFVAGSPVQLTATPGADSVFTGWGGDCTGTASTCSVTMSGARNVVATFTFARILTVGRAGAGSGTIRGPGIDCGTSCSAPADGTVSLSAAPATGSYFAGWAGDCSGTAPTCSVTMDASRNVTARFEPLTLAVSLSGAGIGTVTSLPAGIDCGAVCTTDGYAAGTPVTLTARPDANSVFVGWGGDCSGTSTTCRVTMSAARRVTAQFDPVALTVFASGSGTGTVRSIPAGIDCGAVCTSTGFPVGTDVTLTAAPSAGSVFAGWSDACSGTSPTCTVRMDGSRSVTASFQVPALTITRSGNGTVRSDPSGIDCGTGCSARFPAGSIVRLTAAPAAGWSFAGWSGDCSGSASTCDVTMDTARRAVTARFISPSTVTVGATSFAISESGGSVVIPVIRRPTTGTASVNYTTSSGTAASGLDFTPTSGTLNFAAGVESLNIVVPIINDSLLEGSETFTVSLGSPVGAVLGTPNVATVTIFDDDGDTSNSFRVGAATYSVSEGGGSISIPVTRSSSAGSATVDYYTWSSEVEAGASSGADYTPVAGTLSFAPGVSTRNIVVPILPDSQYEGSQTFYVQLTSPVGGVLGTPTTATVTITEDDPRPATVVLVSSVPVTGLSGVQGSERYYSFTHPGLASNVTFTLSGTDDADLYVSIGSVPTLTSWDCRPYYGDANEVCSFPSPPAGTLYAMIKGYHAYSGVSLVVVRTTLLSTGTPGREAAR